MTGRCELSQGALAAAGFDAVYPLTTLEPDPQRCIENASALLRRTASTLLKDWVRSVG